MATKIIIDTDPGVDDTIAICMALRSPEVQVLGLTSVFGNVKGEVTAQNALRLVELEGHGDIPVARGSDLPLFSRFEMDGAVVHGEDGMGNTHPPTPRGKVIERTAAQFIVDTVRANPGEMTLLAIGPLTNLALALRLDPGIAGLVKEVVVMGGAAACPGNMTPVAEANIWHDAHAADTVMAAGWPLVLVGLDVTQKTVMSAQFRQELFRADNAAVRFIEKIIPCYVQFADTVYRMDGGIYTHDPSAMAYIIRPDLFSTRSAPVFVETEGRCIGQTVADWQHQWEARPEVKVCLDVDSAGVLALIRERLTR
ncbi:MAG: nucleoside hydrolase [Anaerolineae bacterium]|nr:nucleoside hydrolase [Anaerolineae bacterium]